jgi:hypothetical protein
LSYISETTVEETCVYNGIMDEFGMMLEYNVSDACFSNVVEAFGLTPHLARPAKMGVGYLPRDSTMRDLLLSSFLLSPDGYLR